MSLDTPSLEHRVGQVRIPGPRVLQLVRTDHLGHRPNSMVSERVQGRTTVSPDRGGLRERFSTVCDETRSRRPSTASERYDAGW